MLAGGLGHLACPLSALASSSGAPSDVAKEKYERALRAYNSRRYAEAVLLLEEVRRLYGSPSALLLLGHSYLRLDRLGSAYQAYKEAERDAAERLASGPNPTYDEARKTALVHLADLERQIPYLTLAVPSDLPPDFVLLLDGKPVPAASWGTALPVDPGSHEIAATGMRLFPYKSAVVLQPGGRARVDVSPGRQSSARVIVHLPERVPLTDVDLRVDDQKQPVPSAATNLFLDPGPHRIEVVAARRRSLRYQRDFVNGDLVELRPSLRRVTPRWATFVAGGVAVTSLALTVGLGTKAQQDHDVNIMVAKTVPPEPNLDEYYRRVNVQQSIRQMANVATGLAVVGGIAGAATIALALTADWSSGSASAGGDKKVNLAIRPGLGSLLLSGDF